jgi:hypothetical protein
VQRGRREVLLGVGESGISRRETFLKRAVSHKRAFVTQLVSHREVREKVFGKMARQKAKRKNAATLRSKEKRDLRRTPEGVTLLVDTIFDSSTNLGQAKKFMAKFLKDDSEFCPCFGWILLKKLVG